MCRVALAGELQREAAVLGDLLEHVIEEAEAGLDMDRQFAIQVHFDLDVGFLGLAEHGRDARFGQSGEQRSQATCRPVFLPCAREMP